MTAPENDPTPADLKARLDRLSTALDAADGSTSPDGATPGSNLADRSVGSAMSLGFRVLTEFVAAIVVGALIGWQLDVWLKTTPVLMIVFLALGTAAGFWNVYRIAVKPTGGPR